MCWARYLFVGVVIGLGTLSMISACGQKGPLYLPEQTPDNAAAAPSGSATQAAPAPGADVPKPVDRAADAAGQTWPR
jgi:predicted small lipoprotein YifL